MPSRRRSLAVAAALAGVVVALGLTPVSGSSAPVNTTACGKVSFKVSGKTYVYSVRRDRGTTTCRRARVIMRGFLVSATIPRTWFCVRGHANQGQRWAASCSNTSGALLRVFGPLKS